ncbi:hypothetical protein EV360DRAFT_74916 [Lentinula raphanica]|nr:hypothetical protein EV360DRAFT_74916 [Lentinula raphanica]
MTLNLKGAVRSFCRHSPNTPNRSIRYEPGAITDTPMTNTVDRGRLYTTRITPVVAQKGKSFLDSQSRQTTVRRDGVIREFNRTSEIVVREVIDRGGSILVSLFLDRGSGNGTRRRFHTLWRSIPTRSFTFASPTLSPTILLAVPNTFAIVAHDSGLWPGRNSKSIRSSRVGGGGVTSETSSTGDAFEMIAEDGPVGLANQLTIFREGHEARQGVYSS